MGIYVQPPGPVTGPAGGTQPYGARKLFPSLLSVTPDNPLPRSNAALLEQVLIAWQPPPNLLSQPREQIAPLLPAAEPPAFSQFSLPLIVQSWLAGTPYPYQPEKLFPSALSVTPDNPPPTSWFPWQVLAAWQPLPNARQGDREPIAPLLPAVVEQLPFAPSSLPLIVQSWQATWGPYGQGKAPIAALLPGVIEQLAFSQYPLGLIVQSWLPAWRPYGQQEKLFPSALSITPDPAQPRSHAGLLSPVLIAWAAPQTPPRGRAPIILPAAASIPLGKLAVFFADFAVEAIWGARSALVLLDAPDEEWLSGAVQSREYAITYAASQLPGLKSGGTLIVDGVSYRVREVTALDDGALMRATLTKP